MVSPQIIFQNTKILCNGSLLNYILFVITGCASYQFINSQLKTQPFLPCSVIQELDFCQQCFSVSSEHNVHCIGIEGDGRTMLETRVSLPPFHVSHFLLGQMVWLPGPQLPVCFFFCWMIGRLSGTHSPEFGTPPSCFLPSSPSLQPSADFSDIQWTTAPTLQRGLDLSLVKWGSHRLFLSLRALFKPGVRGASLSCFSCSSLEFSVSLIHVLFLVNNSLC